MNQQTDRCALVTGAASGIGRAVALELGERGIQVGVADQQPAPREDPEAPPTHELLRERGVESFFHSTDVSRENDVRDLVERLIESWGRLDILVNNAGLFRVGSVQELELRDWNRLLEVNLTGIFLCSKHALPHLRTSEQARIINVASQLGLVGGPSMAAYCASKGGVVNLTRQMAMDYAADGITVNAVCPGVIRTAMTAPIMENPDMRAHLEKNTPVPFLGEPEDVAHAVGFVASEKSRYMTGHALVIDGGWTAR